ncbi:tyrosine-type recombinase/integrase [Flammeovirga aprica]|uniref:Tyrosine-type recombinase/integrase n=1 Tax=Flammeovirga aprica JL-4 TaxID=694437 RepID=A0A7X9S257_9BACT|nr:tyrosine-type recombinase/integrase [Flammeovirga aprica]NME72924.1 tyrosine-type recombinase/integrase [Flammeovirga aprica JL-4]
MYNEVYRNMSLSGKSKSTFDNYIKSIAKIALHFNKTPLELSDDEINDYLLQLKEKKQTSYTAFKHYVYALRYIFKYSGREEKNIKLPVLKKKKAIPDILSVEECKVIFKIPDLLKYRVMFTLIYSAGLRIREVAQLKIADIDLQRMTIYVRDTKYAKNRVVPLAENMKVGIKKYLETENPNIWLFQGYGSQKHIATTSIGRMLKQTVKAAKINKKVTTHTLRHTYATHCVEMGMDPFTLKELLGHESLQTTLEYINLTAVKRSNSFSPFDKIYEAKS